MPHRKVEMLGTGEKKRELIIQLERWWARPERDTVHREVEGDIAGAVEAQVVGGRSDGEWQRCSEELRGCSRWVTGLRERGDGTAACSGERGHHLVLSPLKCPPGVVGWVSSVCGGCLK